MRLDTTPCSDPADAGQLHADWQRRRQKSDRTDEAAAAVSGVSLRMPGIPLGPIAVAAFCRAALMVRSLHPTSPLVCGWQAILLQPTAPDDVHNRTIIAALHYAVAVDVIECSMFPWSPVDARVANTTSSGPTSAGKALQACRLLFVQSHQCCDSHT